MSKIFLDIVGRPEIPPREISPRLRSQLVYFSGLPKEGQTEPLGEGEYWFVTEEVDRWVDEGVFYLVSPLDTANMTEVELSEEQEEFLNWLQKNRINRARVRE